MSGIVLSASVRQNLLSLQSTADLLATTQNRLSTGKKVNTALDNPTNYFTAASLDNRASDINNLLDGIGNGVQVLQAANTGITSLQKLIDSARSVGNQVLQSAVGYSSKSNISTTAIAGATAADLRGTPTTFTDASKVGSGAVSNRLSSPVNITGATLLTGGTNTDSVLATAGLTTSDTITVNGTVINFTTAGSGTSDATHVRLDASITTLLGVIDGAQGGTGSAVASGIVTVHTGTTADLNITGTAGGYALLAALNLTTGTTPVTQARGGGTTALGGLTLTIGATGGGTATNLTFGDGTGGTVKTLNDLNAKLSANNLQATIDGTGVINISATNDVASFTIGTVGGTAAGVGHPFNGAVGTTPVLDPAAQLVRSNLVAQYNNILDQINTTAQDSSFNGINLLNGDQLKLTFNETGSSTLKIQGVTFNAAGLSLSKLSAGIDFLDNKSASSIINQVDAAGRQLRTQASSLGSNLSIVQIRQDFSKNLINVLQTGSANLTLADTNEEAANSQALSTRQSIAVSALALANQSQQSVLQLLR